MVANMHHSLNMLHKLYMNSRKDKYFVSSLWLHQNKYEE